MRNRIRQTLKNSTEADSHVFGKTQVCSETVAAFVKLTPLMSPKYVFVQETLASACTQIQAADKKSEVDTIRHYQNQRFAY
jgi:hypothetical protein